MNEKILRCIKRISPHAMEYVKEGLNEESVEIILSDFKEGNEGVFLIVKGEDCDIFYASFYGKTIGEDTIRVIRERTSDHLTKVKKDEICFNVYGENRGIIEIVRDMGFKTDMKGYHLQYSEDGLEMSDEMNLRVRGFEEDSIDELVTLMDGAYHDLHKENGWKVNYYADNKVGFLKKMMRIKDSECVKTFWLGDEMVGAYIYQGNYITDVVVGVNFQGRGFGRDILAHCIDNMRENGNVQDVRLRVAESNDGAKRLYHRLGFKEIAYFAEHTYE